MNPSAASQRLPVALLATVGLAAASMLALDAHGVLRAWEPFPIVDARGWVLEPRVPPLPELDVVGFAALLVSSILGSRRRWQDRPGLAIATGTISGLLALACLVRWSLQYAVTGMTSTAFSIVTISATAALALAIDELYAAVVRKHRLVKHAPPANAPYRSLLGLPLGSRVAEWPGYAAGAGALILGVALLFAARWAAPHPAFHARVVGGLVATIGALSLPRIGRSLRWLNAAIGGWLLVAPLVHGYGVAGTLQSVIFGILLMLVSVALAEPDASAVDESGRVARST